MLNTFKTVTTKTMNYKKCSGGGVNWGDNFFINIEKSNYSLPLNLLHVAFFENNNECLIFELNPVTSCMPCFLKTCVSKTFLT